MELGASFSVHERERGLPKRRYERAKVTQASGVNLIEPRASDPILTQCTKYHTHNTDMDSKSRSHLEAPARIQTISKHGPHSFHGKLLAPRRMPHHCQPLNSALLLPCCCG